jgi:D-serine deaminase-like pyridoxal phosphate-dependent protein
MSRPLRRRRYHDGMQSTDRPLKGLAPQRTVGTLRARLADRPSLFDGTFSPPVMTLHRSALEHNITTMARYCRDHGVLLAPHGKTTMAGSIFERQLAAGAWAITVATPAQIAYCRSIGIPRILLANELLDGATIDWLAGELAADPDFDFLCYVDSLEGVDRLARGFAASPAAAGSRRPFDVLVEMGYQGGRTGCRTVPDAVEVARAAAAADGVRVVGVAGFEGGIGSGPAAEVLAAVDAFLDSMHAAANVLVEAGLVEDPGGGVILSAGGSVFFDRVAATLARPLPAGRASRCVLRSGCYVTHDSGFYERTSPFTRPGAGPGYSLRPALEVWAEVLSTPEPGLALLGIGRRDVAFDRDLPVPLRWLPAPDRAARPAASRPAFRDASACSVRALNDQHAFVAVADRAVRPGDWMSFGISHPCTAMDKWRLLMEIDDEFRVVDLVETTF